MRSSCSNPGSPPRQFSLACTAGAASKYSAVTIVSWAPANRIDAPSYTYTPCRPVIPQQAMGGQQRTWQEGRSLAARSRCRSVVPTPLLGLQGKPPLALRSQTLHINLSQVLGYAAGSGLQAAQTLRSCEGVQAGPGAQPGTPATGTGVHGDDISGLAVEACPGSSGNSHPLSHASPSQDRSFSAI